MATKNTRKAAPHTRRSGTRTRKALAIGAEQRMFLAVDVAAAALMGRREGYAEACATQALQSTVAVLDGFTAKRPAPSERFTKLDDAGKALPVDALAWSQVRDNETGLIWAAETMDGSHKWKAAHSAASGTRTAGRDDWRLPTITELLGIVDYTRTDPASDIRYFRTKSGWYWSSSTYAASPSDYAWGVYFDYGSSDWYPRDHTGFVRAVRSVAVPVGQ